MMSSAAGDGLLFILEVENVQNKKEMMDNSNKTNAPIFFHLAS